MILNINTPYQRVMVVIYNGGSYLPWYTSMTRIWFMSADHKILMISLCKYLQFSCFIVVGGEGLSVRIFGTYRVPLMFKVN